MLTDTQIFDAIRKRRNAPLTQAHVDTINTIMYPATGVVSPADPAWITAARRRIGEGEIRGPKHNSWIAKGWARLGAGWYNDDETPWCGFFVADCLSSAGLPYPKNFPAAASFRTWGSPVKAQLGAIGVKVRPGGNHTFFIVGETPDKQFFKALGGNQSNAVNIMDIRKSETDAIRWPQGAAAMVTGLPVLPPGRISRNES